MRKTITCPRCNGLGTLPMFAHVDSGICYLCLGTGTIDITDGEKWSVYEVPMESDRDFDTKGSIVRFLTSNESGTEYLRLKLYTKSSEWAHKIYYVLGMWTTELLHPQKAWDKLQELKSGKTPTEMAKLINDEYTRAETRPCTKNRYYLENKDTYESVWCDKDGNPLK